MDTKHNSGTPASSGAYETRDANPRSLARFGLGLVLTLALAWGASLWIFDYFERVQKLGPPPTPFELGREVPPAPQLQAKPVQDLEQARQGEQGELHSYGWVDRSRGIVHIPIHRAMELLLQRGLPVRPGAGSAEHGQPPPKAAIPPAAGLRGDGN
jgi:hypothetical protein